MPRWPETSSETNLALIKRERERGRPPYLIAQMLGKRDYVLDKASR